MSTNRPDISFIFNITDKVLWNVFKKNEIGDVLLPFVVLRRLDCILKDKNENVRNAYENFKGKVADDKLAPILKKAAGGLNFYNISRHTFDSLKESTKTIDIDFHNYLNGFNDIVIDILDNFQFEKIIARLQKNKLLYEMVKAMCNVDLSLDQYDNHKMGYVFEELIRISNEQSNETAGEHFTPRDVIELMYKVMFSTEKENLSQSGIIRTIYDPTMGTGGMVNLAKNYIVDELIKSNTKPTIFTYGQEINEQSYAIAKAEALISGGDVENIKHGNTLTNDRFPDKKFHYQFANPPYGVTWAKDYDFVANESTNPAGRFYAGLPSKSDGQLLFLQHMISKMEPTGGKIAVVTNGSPLFSGNAGGGESDIRKFIIESDLLDCIVSLPKDMFYNTGIGTYIWFLDNNKPAHRRGKVQLINASDVEDKKTDKTGFAISNKRSLGNKRNEILEYHIDIVVDIYTNFEENEYSKIFENEFFGYYSVPVERPLYDETGKYKKKKNGELEPDTKKRSTERIQLSDDIRTYFKEKILPHVDFAWPDANKIKIGYEINFSKYFYNYVPLRPSNEIKQEILDLEFGTNGEKGISDLIKELFV
ncbi:MULTISPECIES: class I SAM-dependent DNA methyltransferase [Elizabethkingia]|uniref:site-specific DNA-methyltransferase (adenine-specific) n=1 Tax=Elizabethkingia meningoseptica TaxID=238 RepID=A0A1T3EZT8_ELIME|nr:MULTISPECIES: class I SAM-dependent DNA methyltransferase [Elizabethkingia]AQX10938.1 restriction endonuclease subunit M [Elizabethkingia meningoseptica]MBG0512256.1 SAM-dependent DNA methyltransferase [Elizabethkingia meningoseptica]MDE5436032.1 type I restriction-modification system subunit M [Elizabethkingia meningoseptica]MDE5480459.1 type I restriction-modification system subunit M [Elizabethkingia meningoseptica]MDE5492784.1 type I restriction-modification system subunit M [Elizabethk